MLSIDREKTSKGRRLSRGYHRQKTIGLSLEEDNLRKDFQDIENSRGKTFGGFFIFS